MRLHRGNTACTRVRRRRWRAATRAPVVALSNASRARPAICAGSWARRRKRASQRSLLKCGRSLPDFGRSWMRPSGRNGAIVENGPSLSTHTRAAEYRPLSADANLRSTLAAVPIGSRLLFVRVCHSSSSLGERVMPFPSIFPHLQDSRMSRGPQTMNAKTKI